MNEDFIKLKKYKFIQRSQSKTLGNILRKRTKKHLNILTAFQTETKTSFNTRKSTKKKNTSKKEKSLLFGPFF